MIRGKRVGVFVRHPRPVRVDALEQGLRAIGCEILGRDPEAFGGGKSDMSSEEAVVISAITKATSRVLSAFRQHRPEAPLISVEPPFLAERRGGEWARLVVAEGYWMPSKAREGVKLRWTLPETPVPERGHVLLIGFSPGSPGQPSQAEAEDIVSEWIERARLALDDAEIVWRPHPIRPWIPRCVEREKLRIDRSVSGGPDPAMQSIQGASLVVCHTSAAGLWAGLAGRPVICHETAFYAALGCDWGGELLPKREEALSIALRAASAEWPLSALASGEALEWLEAETAPPPEEDPEEIAEAAEALNASLSEQRESIVRQIAETEAKIVEIKSAKAQSVATPAKPAAPARKPTNANEAKAAGRAAKANGLPIAANPFHHRSSLGMAWRSGWKGEG